MAAAHVTENQNANLADSSLPNVEFVQFTTAASGDYYDCKKLSQVDAAFASQSTTDGEFLQVSWALKTNGQPRVTITTGATGVVTGYLTVIGRL